MRLRTTLSDVVQHAQRTLAECMQFFCGGRAEFPKSLQNFRPIFAQILRHLDAGLARNLALERITIQKRAATKRCGLRNHAGRVHAVFMRAAPRIFSETSQFFRASWAQNLRDPDARRLIFSNLDAILTQSTLSDVVKYPQRTLAKCMQFFVRGACRISENFANFSRDFLRKICVVSTLDSRFIFH